MSTVPQRPLLDTNVLLDAVLRRQPWAEDANRIILALDSGLGRGVLCATTLTNYHYIARKFVGNTRALADISAFLHLYDIAPVDEAVLRAAQASNFVDFEDAVLHASAMATNCDAIITRDINGFATAKLPVYTPAEYVIRLRLLTRSTP